MNEDRAVTGEEMEAYLGDRVPYWARRFHDREQTPRVAGRGKDRVLVKYNRTVPGANE